MTLIECKAVQPDRHLLAEPLYVLKRCPTLLFMGEVQIQLCLLLFQPSHALAQFNHLGLVPVEFDRLVPVGVSHPVFLNEDTFQSQFDLFRMELELV